MDTSSVPLKQCSRKEKCINPLGSRLPQTTEHFRPRADRLGKWYARCRVCDSAIINPKRRDERLVNPEPHKERSRIYREHHREEARLKTQQWRESDPERARECDRRSHEKHKTDDNERVRQWRKDHPEQAAEYSRQRRAKYPHEKRAYEQKRRARKKSSEGTFTPAEIATLWKLSKGRCWWCGGKIKDGKYHVDHRIPLAKGGNNTAGNLCIACPHCNLSKHDKLPQDFNGRLL